MGQSLAPLFEQTGIFFKVQCVMFGDFFKKKQQHRVLACQIAASFNKVAQGTMTPSPDLAGELRWFVHQARPQPLKKKCVFMSFSDR